MNPQVAREIAALRARLDALAREADTAADDGPLPDGDLDALVCRLGETRLALPLFQVQEVVHVPATAPLPEAPPWVLGLLDLRGEVVPVLDVAARFERRESRVAVTDHVVICRDEGAPVGLLVPGVEGVVRLSRMAAPPELQVPHAWYVREAREDRAGVVLVLGLRRLVALAELPPLPAELPEVPA